MQRIYITLVVVFLCIAGASAQSNNKLVAASAARGKTVYLQRCMVCHQADGGGVPKLNAPLDGSSTVNGTDVAKLIKYIVKGFVLDDERLKNPDLPFDYFEAGLSRSVACAATYDADGVRD